MLSREKVNLKDWIKHTIEKIQRIYQLIYFIKMNNDLDNRPNKYIILIFWSAQTILWLGIQIIIIIQLNDVNYHRLMITLILTMNENRNLYIMRV